MQYGLRNRCDSPSAEPASALSSCYISLFLHLSDFLFLSLSALFTFLNFLWEKKKKMATH